MHPYDGRVTSNFIMQAINNEGTLILLHSTNALKCIVCVVSIYNIDCCVTMEFLISHCISISDITIYGDGSQTRSFCFVDDLVDGLFR